MSVDQQSKLKVVRPCMLERANKGSLIRKMFEEANRLKQLHGPDASIQDFSIGNPTLPPPELFNDALKDLVQNPPAKLHSYMPNNGLPEAREAVARIASTWHDVSLEAQHVYMCVGAAGGINVLLRATCEPEDEIIFFAPYFAEYIHYCFATGAKPVILPTNDQFDPDLEALRNAITPRTRAVLINSPNNPTGRIYSRAVLEGIASVLNDANTKHERPILLIADEPYRRIAYEAVPPTLCHYDYSFVGGSFSKDLSIPGERLGYILVNPAIWTPELHNTLTYLNRILGFVNAPSLMQYAVARSVEATIDTDWYRVRRDALLRGLAEAGIECVAPGGTFYLFPKVPEGMDDDEFVGLLSKRLVLVVPGMGFGAPGYFRISYAVTMDAITEAIPKFKEAADEAREILAARRSN
eukprot:gnl/Trimastix_PCT/1500.p1 GENE.gnl/Trimastix_PCT/1500~~gnl/Trimastix_PCT/1500.p1  ORF type:complete len:411 (+),score=138.77 gnl/Trimastix_PCT/1500:36-1268(+)